MIRTPMTADEMAAELYRRQGYLVLSSTETHDIGDIVWETVNAIGKPISAPLRIVGLSSYQEFAAQMAAAARICPRPYDAAHYPDTIYFRVEAAD